MTDTVRLVVAMASRKIHMSTCRYVREAGSWSFPFADDGAIDALPHAGCCMAWSAQPKRRVHAP